MTYNAVCRATFLRRPNRFIAHCLLDGQEVVCHVKNTGRCRELLVPGAVVYLQKQDSPTRRTAFDLIAVEKAGRLINMDAYAPNLAVGEWIRAGGLADRYGDLTLCRPEYKMGASRFDFYMEYGKTRVLLEVKGVTLEQDGIVRFPDAPTERGTKHLHELAALSREGWQCWAVFLIQMEQVRYFAPNRATDPAFALALEEAAAAGVHLLALDSLVTPDSMTANRPAEIRLQENI